MTRIILPFHHLVVLTQPGVQQAAERSAQSDFVFLPFRFGRDRITSLFGRPAHELLRWMPATVLIQAAEDIDLDAEPESGEVAERAEALDALTDALRRAEKAAKTAAEKATYADKAREKLAELKAAASPADEAALLEAEKAAQSASQEAERAARKAAKARAKKELAAKEAAGHEPGLEAAAESSGGGVEDDRNA